MNIKTVPTKHFPDSKAGTSGLRKPVTVFAQPGYVENFVQSLFTHIPPKPDSILVTGGDGRYYLDVAVQKVIKVAIGNGYRHIIVGQDGILSTPAVSAIIRDRKALGGVILTASHNPGGPDKDFGMKYNYHTGAPAPESLIDKQYEIAEKLTEYKIADIPDVDTTKIGIFTVGDGIKIEVIDSCILWLNLMKNVFDFSLIKPLFTRKDFSFVFDALHGVTGRYATRLFIDEFNAVPESLHNCNLLPDFGGLHPDPNQVHAHNLVAIMNGKDPKYKDKVPVLGAACDGDGDRNMILGANTFVNPADSLAIIAENAGDCVPYFIDPVTKKVNIKGVARSSPTAGALDIVAQKKGLHCFETPTGWKFFGNLMDADKLSICGEESFGTGCDVIREKDGLWAVLTWMSIIAHKTNLLAAKNIAEGKIQKGKELDSPLVTVSDIVHEYWHRNGRFFIQRHDYDVADKNVGVAFYDGLKPKLVGKTTEEIEKAFPSSGIKSADIFDYTDPIDHSISLNQGVRIYFLDGSRVVIRLSGTAGSGATIRVYFEKYSTDEAKFDDDVSAVLAPLVLTINRVTDIQKVTQKSKPDVIT